MIFVTKKSSSIFADYTYLIRGHVKLGMFCEVLLVFVSFVTLVAFEKRLPSVRSHVPLQIA